MNGSQGCSRKNHRDLTNEMQEDRAKGRRGGGQLSLNSHSISDPALGMLQAFAHLS